MDFSRVNLSTVKSGDSITVNKIPWKDTAIIGLAARLPRAGHAAQFWNNLKDGVDCIGEFPGNRQEDSDRILGYMNLEDEEIEFCQGGYLDEIDRFDCDFFNITPQEASLIDPNQRLFLQAAWHALEEAGYGGNNIKGTRTGVFVGYSGWPAYWQIISQAFPAYAALSRPGNLSSIIASRVSYILDLKGPAMLVDTACSSSLVAVHLACRSIRNRECDLAIAGGVKVSLIQMFRSKNRGIGIDSSDFRTRAFDDRSDGTGWGEGVAAILLKPLSKAIGDGDHIHAVIKGSAVNQDGNSIGITAPNSEAQEDVIVRAWEDAGIDPQTIGYVEAHGTGTRLGDPIEVEAIKRAFRRYTARKQFCALGSVKTNIGHLDDVAGIAGLLKAILALKYRKIPPQLHFNRPNKEIPFEESGLYVNDRLIEWENEGGERRCGVSSFGLSGTNCHVVLEEFNGRDNRYRRDSKPRQTIEIFTISARNKDTLGELLRAYREFLAYKDDGELADICFTANTGRGHYRWRLAVIVREMHELKRKLALWGRGLNGMAGEGIFWSDLQEGRQDSGGRAVGVKELSGKVDAKIRQYLTSTGREEAFLSEIADLYCKGADVDWNRLYANRRRHRVSLPLTPFRGARCWLKFADSGGSNMSRPAAEGADGNGQEVVLKGRDDGSVYSRQEKMIGQVWSEITGHGEIDINRSFFDLGGDSLIANLMLPKLSKALNVDISLSEFFGIPTIGELAHFISRKESIQAAFIPVQGKRDFYPVSSAQKRVFIGTELFGNGCIYNQPNAFVVEGRLDGIKVARGFERLIRRHESLRTGFVRKDGEIVQRVYDYVDFNVSYREEEMGAEDIDDAVEKFIRPFSLADPPLLRVELVRTAASRYLLLYDIHHIVADGRSLDILINEFSRLYSGEELPPLTIQYRDFAVWQNQFLQSSEIKKQEDFWLNEFNSGEAAAKLPTDFARPAEQSFGGSYYPFSMEKALCLDIHRLAARTNTTLFMIFVAALSILLAKYTDSEKIVVGAPVLGRRLADLADIIGMFTNTVAIKNHPYSHFTLRQYIEAVRQKVILVLENQDYQFEMLVDKLNIPRDSGRHPLFDVFLALENQRAGHDFRFADGVTFSRYDFLFRYASFDLLLHVIEVEKDIECGFLYSTELFRQDTIEKMAGHFINLFREITRNPGGRIGDLDILNISRAGEAVERDNKKSWQADFNF